MFHESRTIYAFASAHVGAIFSCRELLLHPLARERKRTHTETWKTRAKLAAVALDGGENMFTHSHLIYLIWCVPFANMTGQKTTATAARKAQTTLTIYKMHTRTHAHQSKQTHKPPLRSARAKIGVANLRAGAIYCFIYLPNLTRGPAIQSLTLT